MNEREKQMLDLTFRNRVLESEGIMYEKFFVKTMRKYNSSFQGIGTYGNKGDYACDGRNQELNEYYQVYAPQDISEINTFKNGMKKLEHDYSRALNHWPIKSFFFVVNDKFRGLNPELARLADKLSNEKNVKISLFDANSLRDIFNRLSFEDKCEVLGFYPENEFSCLVDCIPPLPTNDSIYHYLSKNNIPVVGRTKELEFLGGFLKDKTIKASFVVVSGPAGCGKSKLVHELTKETKYKQNWKFCFVRKEILYQIADLTSWYYEKCNLCLIVDYANEEIEALKKWFNSHFSSKRHSSRKKLRIILIAREGKQEDYPEWFKRMTSRDFDLGKVMYGKQDFYEISGITNEACKELIKAYCKILGIELVPESITKGIIRDIEKIKLEDRVLKDSTIRPLYALFTIDAHVRGKNIIQWDKDAIHQYIYDKDIEGWQNGILDDGARVNLKQMLLFATISGKWDPGAEVIMPEFLYGISDSLCNTILSRDEHYEDWFKVLSGYTYLSDDQNSYVLPGLSPDVVGEFYVLQYLKKLRALKGSREMKKRSEDWVRYFASNIHVCKDFFVRAIQNYGTDNTFGGLIINLLDEMLSHDNDELAFHKDYTDIVYAYVNSFSFWNSGTAVHKKFSDWIKTKSDIYNHKFVCWAEMESHLIYRFSKNDFAFSDESRFERIKNSYDKWKESEEIAIAYVSFLGVMLEYHIGSDNMVNGLPKEKNKEYLRCFSDFLMAHREIQNEHLAIEVFEACIKVITVLCQRETTVPLGDKFSMYLCNFANEHLDHEQYMLTFVDDAGKILIQILKMNDREFVFYYLEVLQNALEGALEKKWFAICLTGIMTLAETIDCLCQYQFFDIAERVTVYFTAYVEQVEKSFGEAWYISRHKETALSRLFSSGFIPEKIRTVLSDPNWSKYVYKYTSSVRVRALSKVKIQELILKLNEKAEREKKEREAELAQKKMAEKERIRAGIKNVKKDTDTVRSEKT